MKRSLIISVVLITMAAATMPLIAEGIQEQADPVQQGVPGQPAARPGARPYGWNNAQAAQPEELELSGTVKLSAGHTLLQAEDGKEYRLMYPLFVLDELDIEDGEEVLLEGFLIPAMRWAPEEDEHYLRVTKAVINGEEYEIGNARYAGRRMDPRMDLRMDHRQGGPGAGRSSRSGMMGPKRSY